MIFKKKKRGRNKERKFMLTKSTSNTINYIYKKSSCNNASVERI